HPAFLALGENLEECATKYRQFCYQYKPNEKHYKPFHWGSQLLPKITPRSKKTTKKKKKPDKNYEEAKRLYEYWQENHREIVEVAEKFMYANCYNKTHLREFLENYY
ncbi:MAG: transposase, partial [Gomphosphaeria aponina SAG 52.96 = DSM 107014]|nr:transposase [Gomphosphaeria aponina SAG 52.96 = DSM 107014]